MTCPFVGEGFTSSHLEDVAPVGSTATSMWGWLTGGDGATERAAKSLPVALRTYLMMAAPGVATAPVGDAAAAVTTLRTFSSIFLATLTTAAVILLAASSVITGAIMRPSSEPSSLKVSSTFTTSSNTSVSFSRVIRSRSALETGLAGVVASIKSWAIVP